MTEKGATRDFFFSFLQFFFFKWTIFTYPPTKMRAEGGGGICGRLTGHNFGHPLDRKQIFFYGQPYIDGILDGIMLPLLLEGINAKMECTMSILDE